MKTYLLFFSFIFITSQFNYGQTTFYSDYTPLPSSGYFNTSLLIDCIDGNNMVSTDNFLDTTITIYKIDNLGNTNSGNQFKFPFLVSTLNVISTTDSAVAYLLAPFNSPYCAVVMKVDLAGDLIWAEGLEVIGGATFYAITPARKGGMVLAGGGCSGHDMTLFLDDAGNIEYQVAHENLTSPLNIYTFGMMSDGNNEYTGWGVSYINNFRMLFYNIDSIGDLSNVTLFPDLIFKDSFRVPKTFMAKSKNGGHYCMGALVDSTLNDPVSLFYFDSNNQRVWSKTIATPDSLITPTNIIGTSDGGCIVVAGIYFNSLFMAGSGYPNLPVFMKFDSTGILQWSKMPGDTSMPGWRFLDMNSVVSTSDDGLICTLNNINGASICKMDSLINGFCENAMSYNPMVADLIPVTILTSTLTSQLNFTANPIPVVVNQIPIYSNSDCMTLDVAHVVGENPSPYSVYPNPGTGSFIFSNNNSTEMVEINIFNSLDELIYSSANISDKKEINLNNYPEGIYFARIGKLNNQRALKIIIQKD